MTDLTPFWEFILYEPRMFGLAKWELRRLEPMNEHYAVIQVVEQGWTHRPAGAPYIKMINKEESE